MRLARSLIPLLGGLLAAPAALADGYTGDVGLGLYTRQGLYQGESTQTDLLPYVFGEWGRFFGRVDTFGVRLMPMGHGHLEVSTRIVQDQMDSDHLQDQGVQARKNSRLLGLSTFQITPLGGLSISLMQDVGKSKGQIIDTSWIGRFQPASWLTIYPEIGVEILSAKYTRYYYGVEEGEGGYRAYQPGMAASPYVAIHTSTPLGTNWNLALTLRDKPLATAITDSPLIGRTSRWNGYLAVSYKFD